jgi:iron(III) transport system substrate-binding protein
MAADRNGAGRRLTRRTLLRGAVLGGAASWLAACQSSGSSGPPAASTAATPSSPSAASASAAPPPDWQREWNTLIEAARREGTLVVFGPPTPAARVELPRAFKSQFGVDMEYTGGGTGDLIPRLLAERGAGHHTLDVITGGAQSLYTQAYPAKLLDPIPPALIHPDATDGSKWLPGRVWYMDPEQQYILRLSNQVELLVAINTQHIDAAALGSWHDLIDPRLQGKIGLFDPTITGTGSTLASYLLKELGEDYVRKLYRDQRPGVSRDYRQLSDWLARGTYPIVHNLRPTDIEAVRADGFPIELVLRDRPELPAMVSGSGGLATLVNGAPHPNAARLFINWVAMRDGNEAWNRAMTWASVRTDTDNSWVPEYSTPRPGVRYFDTYEWDFTLNTRSPEQMDRLKQITGLGA